VDSFCFCGDKRVVKGLLSGRFASAFLLFAMSGHTTSVRAVASQSFVDERSTTSHTSSPVQQFASGSAEQ
jgi:hypothetical protein